MFGLLIRRGRLPYRVETTRRRTEAYGRAESCSPALQEPAALTCHANRAPTFCTNDAEFGPTTFHIAASIDRTRSRAKDFNQKISRRSGSFGA